MRRRSWLRTLVLPAALVVPAGVLLRPRAGGATDAYALRKLRGFDGKLTNLAEQAGGKLLVVVVMKGHWCGVCIAQLLRLAAYRPQLERLGAKVVGLNADSVKANRAMALSQGVPFAVLSDKEQHVLRELDLWLEDRDQPMPSLLVFDRCGKEALRWLGRGPGDRSEKRLLEKLEEIRKRPGCRPRNA